MDTKKIYNKGKDFSIKAGVNVFNYLVGYDIHNYNSKIRKNIRENENNLTKRVLKLSLNYCKEGIRQSVRYAPLILEGLIFYHAATGDMSITDSLNEC